MPSAWTTATAEMPECCADQVERGDYACTFGCGSVVDDDTKMCLQCRDHSANEFECDQCGIQWAKWGDVWERVK